MLEVRLGVSTPRHPQAHSGPQCREMDTHAERPDRARNKPHPCGPQSGRPRSLFLIGHPIPAQNPAETPKRASVDLCRLGSKVQGGGGHGLTPPSPHTRQQ